MKDRIYVSAVAVHANGFQHWANKKIGERVVYRRRGKDCVVVGGKLRELVTAKSGHRHVEIACSCKWGERRGEPES